MLDLNLARSLLFTPGSRPERFVKAAATAADGFIIDLEDAVGPPDKATARTAVMQWLRTREGVSEFAAIEREEGDLERALASANARRAALDQRLETARLTSSLGRYEEPDRVKIIEAPQDPTGPITPAPIMFVVGGLIAGLIGVVIITAVGAVGTKVSTQFNNVANALK